MHSNDKNIENDETEEPNSDRLKKDKNTKIEKVDKSKAKTKKNFWPIKITIITFFISVFVSIIAEIGTASSGIVVAVLLLFFLIIISIVSDGVGVSVTACDLAPLNAMASRKVPYAKTAIWLVKNAEKVNNICADVIGDVCGIVSGACGAALVAMFIINIESSLWAFLIAVIISGIIAALTVGGKAFEKAIAMKKSQELVMFTARIISIFYNPDRKAEKIRKKKTKKNLKEKAKNEIKHKKNNYKTMNK